MPEPKRKRARNHRHPGMNISAVVPQYLYEHVERVAADNEESQSATLARIIEYHHYATAAGADTTIKR